MCVVCDDETGRCLPPTRKRDDELESPTSPTSPPSEEALPLGAWVRAILQQGGTLCRTLPGYTERPAQIEMAELLVQALEEKKHAVVEAHTGTGKSLAYLIPSVLAEKVVIVSTANKALQEQIFRKDIPFVQAHITPFEAALVKGMQNYVCIDRLEEERTTGMQAYVGEPVFDQLVEATHQPETVFDGDFERLAFQVPAALRRKVGADSDFCAWKTCKYFSPCYVRQMRERAAQARVIVVNHSLLLAGAAAERRVLPERQAIILDEGHHLEEEATRAFTVTVRSSQMVSLLALKKVQAHTPENLRGEIMALVSRIWQGLETTFAQSQGEGRGRKTLKLTQPLEEGLQLASRLEDLAHALGELRPLFATEQDETLYKKLIQRTKNLAEQVRLVFAVAEQDQYVYYLEKAEEEEGNAALPLAVSAAPLDVSAWLKDKLFDVTPVIATSATLSTVDALGDPGGRFGPSFAYFRRRVGLQGEDVLERILPAVFDYQHQALLYVPRDLPEPAYRGQPAEDYTLAIARRMYSLVMASSGHAFLLFSSRRMLQRCYDLMAPHLPFLLLKQGDLPRPELLRQFREGDSSVLFGLKSFWEGVDIAGEALSLVVIDKIPFEPPDDPVHEARVALMKARGENWFGGYVLPQAVLRLKQGLGRLLRSHDDRGVMAVLDCRLSTKGYGSRVLRTLPNARRTQVLTEVKQFFV